MENDAGSGCFYCANTRCCKVKKVQDYYWAFGGNDVLNRIADEKYDELMDFFNGASPNMEFYKERIWGFYYAFMTAAARAIVFADGEESWPRNPPLS